ETNHAWNSVKINDKWYLMDVCWASGKIAKRKRKINSGRNDFYYLTPPEEFIKTHRPVKNNWQLLSEPVSMRKYIRIANTEIKTKISWYRFWTPF
ncbi:MAG: hypothetical protein IAF38_00700, partial [Bacteroidia bacterium]|nr:hypothetical protein [Bacteroidia bacterium]